MIRYTIKLTQDEVEEIMGIINKGSFSSHTFRAAYALLNSDEVAFSDKSTNEQISKILKIGMRIIAHIKKRFIKEVMEAALVRKKNSHIYEKKIDGEVEAKLVQLCSSEPPAGYAKWSLRLLADKMVELKYLERISFVGFGENLKKMNLCL